VNTEDWRPLSARLAGDPAGLGWRGEVPAALELPLRDWVHGMLRPDSFLTVMGSDGIAERVLLRLNLVVPAADGGKDEGVLGREKAVRDFLAYGTDLAQLPEVVDTLLYLLPSSAPAKPAPAGSPGQHGTGKMTVMEGFAAASARSSLALIAGRRASLAGLLNDSLSVLRVQADGRGLERRADVLAETAFGEAVDAAEASAGAGSAAAHLRTAWNAVHALHPDAGKGYGEAIKAVEAAAHSVVQPNHSKATLGSMLGQLRDNRGRFSLVIGGKDGRGDIGPIIGCMELLWDGQTSRHGSSRPTRVETPEEAVMAVDLAVMLVQWFVSGRVRGSVPSAGS
jgi:hypothetical protein